MALTCGVKYKPSATPITHCPPLRSKFELRVGAPHTEAAAVTNKGPNIQGMGVRSAMHSWAAAKAASKVSAVRVRSRKFMGSKKDRPNGRSGSNSGSTD